MNAEGISLSITFAASLAQQDKIAATMLGTHIYKPAPYKAVSCDKSE